MEDPKTKKKKIFPTAQDTYNSIMGTLIVSSPAYCVFSSAHVTELLSSTKAHIEAFLKSDLMTTSSSEVAADLDQIAKLAELFIEQRPKGAGAKGLAQMSDSLDQEGVCSTYPGLKF